MIRFYAFLLPCLLLTSFGKVIAQTKYQAPKANTAPIIDGLGNDACWANATWYTVDQLWLGVQPSAADFTGRFKVTWDANKLYILAEITDDILNDYHTNPLTNYWEDDTWEIFLDENASGGNHLHSYNAFAYHISTKFDIADIGPEQTAGLYNNHASVARTNTGTNYVWEAAFDIYNDQYVTSSNNNPKVTLIAGKIMGFAMAYCDNDGGATRQSFIGSEVVAGTDKNVAYINADVFGKIELVDNITPQFTHVRVATGLVNPTAFTIAKDGRIFVCEQTGKVRIIENGQLLTQPALNITVNTSGPAGYTERGLLGITLDPNFASNNYMYIFYTTPTTPAFSRVTRYTLNGNVVIPGSEQVIINLDQLSSAHNHNGGGLHFGKDGKLYIATGENGTPSNAQNLDNTHGKILRLNADGTIPTGNPFTSGSTQRQMIWAYGLRNPFTFDIQESTGKIYVNDVGQTKAEEINEVTSPGLNFGWPTEEGDGTLFTNPVYSYQNKSLINGSDCAITGGCFFEPAATNYPVKYRGKYFFMDYCSKWLRVLNTATGAIVEDFSNNIAANPIGIDVHPDGNLYYLNRGAYDGSGVGNVYKITYSGNLEPEFQSHPESQSIAASQPVTFTSQVTGAGPITYQWYKGTTLVGTNSSSHTISNVSPTDAGNYTVVATNSYGSVTSNVATLTVTAFNSKPVATITSPANNTIFTGGQTFTFTGTGTDAQDGTLAASQFKWKVDLYHATHIHDGIFSQTGKTYTYTIPTTGHTETNIWYRATLVVTDAGGLTDTAYIELQPKKVQLTFNTVPTGLEITLDGEPLPTPATVEGITGISRVLSTNDPQLLNNKAWAFASWNDAAANTRIISTPASNKTYTATFSEVPITSEVASVIGDAFVQYTSWQTSDATTTFGTTNPNDLVVKNYINDPDRETYITFDLSSLGGNPMNLLTAKLKLNGYLMDEEEAPLVNINIYESQSTTWNENTITWNNKPGNKTAIINSFSVNSFATNQTFEIDITEFIKTKLLAGDQIVSIVLKASTDNKNRVFFNSKERGNGPVIELKYESTVTEVLDFDAGKSLIIYPNPANDKLTIYLKNELESGTIKIMNQYSNIVLTQNIRSGQSEHVLDLSNLNKGLYLVHYNNGQKQLTQKLIIK